MKRLLAMTVAASAAMALADSTWIKGSTGGWDDENSWSGGKPTSGSTVIVPEDCDMPVTDDDMSIASVVAGITLAETNSTVTFALNGDASLAGTITGKGQIVKAGTGTLHLLNETVDGYHANLGMTINAGTLECPQTFGSTYSSVVMEVGHVHVEEGATFVPYAKYRITSVSGLTGSGTVNQSAAGNVWPLSISTAGGSVFSGKLAGNIRLTVGSTRQDFTGVESDFGYKSDGNVYVGTGADIGVQSFGLGATKNSLGSNYHSYYKYYCPVVFDGSGKLTYLGEGETSDRWFKFTSTVSAGIDGGAKGGLALTGKFFSSANGQLVMTFGGDNENACSLNSAIVPASAANSIYLAKAGSGTWIFYGNTNNVNGGVVGVEGGTLQFDKLTDAGQPSSFGLSNRLGTKYQGTWDDAKAADYAVLLGSETAEGTIEHIGNLWDNSASDRPIAVTGKGGRIKVDGANRRLGIKNVFAADANGATLTLDGTAGENVLYDATDGHGPLSIVKEGSGSWTLDGDQTFGGELKVKAGTLTVSSTLGTKYSWYRYTIKGRGASSGGRISFRELCLYRANYDRANLSMEDAGDNTIPQPGQASIWRTSVSYNSTSKCPKQGLNYLFEGKGCYDANANYFSCLCGGANPDDGNPDHWIPIVMRVDPAADAANEVDAWDAASSEAASSTSTPAKWTMEASADGLFWDLVTATADGGGTDACAASSSSTWFSNGGSVGSGSLTTRNGGFKFGLDKGKSLRTTAPTQDFAAGGVSVAAGAVLKAEGAVTLKALEVDATGAGTVDGFAFAANGTINVTGSAGPGDIELPLTLSNVQGTPDFSGWSVKMGGTLRRSRKVEYKNGKLTVLGVGLSVIVR